MPKVVIRKRTLKVLEDLSDKTKFSKSEIEKLFNIYVDIIAETKEQKIDRTLFRHEFFTMFNLTDDFILDRIFYIFDKNNDGIVSMKEWINGLSIFLRGDLKEKTLFTFSVYDLNDDGIISRDEINQLIRLSLSSQTNNEDNDDIIRDLVDYSFKRLDVNHDGRIDFDDFFNAVCEDFLFLEFLGPCLPTDIVAKTFLSTFEQSRSQRLKPK